MSSPGGAYNVRIIPSAEREMRTLPKAAFGRARAAILGLEQQPRPHGCRKLEAGKGYRVRIGEYRIIYLIDDRSHAVVIVAVRHRRDAYRR
jgi:mRNA interferase RelE/StbE